MRKTTRRALIGGGIAAGAALAAGSWLWPRLSKPPVGMEIPPERIARGAALVREHPVVDVHAHPGRSFLVGAHPDSLLVRLMPDGFEAERIAGMREAGVTASLLALVADFPVLGLGEGGLVVTRDFTPGEAWRDFGRQLQRVQALVDDGVLSLARTPGEVRAAHAAGKPVTLLGCEGADFCEGRIERIAEAHAAGARAITLLHYRTNALGDTQTSAPVHGGLTPLGRDVVREMNRLGIIIDVAHASFETVRDVVAESRAPVLLSHSDLDTWRAASPRFISLAHARTVTQAGGVIGAWPAGIGSRTLADFVEQVLILVDAVGAAHVAIGSDLDANYRPVLTEYTDFPVLAAALLHRGLSEADIADILGGNFLRLFDTVTSLS
ncbi:MAG TPA: membrane dipeptidase [Woeseiaceae bacterium]